LWKGVFVTGTGIRALLLVDQHARTSWGKPQARAAMLGNEAALFGAIPLLLEDMNDAAI
jgi:hypothetical protein